jgi:mRNA-degrading endonuclease HigB of HigAB toxin-antitoxin module
MDWNGLKTSSTPAENDIFGVGGNRLRLIAAIHFMERDGLRQ